jgi:hypothetical protein
MIEGMYYVEHGTGTLWKVTEVDYNERLVYLEEYPRRRVVTMLKHYEGREFYRDLDLATARSKMISDNKKSEDMEAWYGYLDRRTIDAERAAEESERIYKSLRMQGPTEA